MDYKILEANGVDNENVDGAALNHMSSRGESGIVPGVLNECSVYTSGSSSVIVDTGELIIHGFRVKIISPYSVQRSASASVITHQVFARITLETDRSVQFTMDCRVASALTKEPILSVDHGVYEIEIARFSTSLSGITDLRKTANVVGLSGYTLTDEDKNDISQRVLNMLPVYSGEVTEV